MSDLCVGRSSVSDLVGDLCKVLWSGGLRVGVTGGVCVISSYESLRGASDR